MGNDKKQIGLILEELPNMHFKVELADGKIIRAYASGKIKLNRIKLIINDKVEIVFDPSLGGNIGRIIWKL